MGVGVVNFSAAYPNVHEDNLASLAPIYDVLSLLASYDVATVAAMGNDDRVLEMGAEPKRVFFSSFPALLPFVIGVGGSDVRGWRWREMDIKDRPRADRHPLTDYSAYGGSLPGAVNSRCGMLSPARLQCGSDYGISNRASAFTLGVLNLPAGKYGIALIAPAAQVISTIDRTYTPFACAPTASGGNPCGLPGNPSSYPPNGNRIGNEGVQAYTNLANVPHSSFSNVPANSPLSGYDAYGPMTGTSMATPYVAAAAGLIRSINPLLATGAVKDLLKETATPPPHPPTRGPYTEAEVGAGTLHADAAVRRALGMVGAAQARNRLIPVFSLTSADIKLTIAGAGPRAWLHTSSPQVAMAAIEGRLYQADDPALTTSVSSIDSNGTQDLALPLPQSPANDFGVSSFVVYTRSAQVGVGAYLPDAVYRYPAPYWSTLPKRPTTSFFVFATPFNPISGQANNLKPLFRMSMKCNQIRKHYYAVDDVDRNAAAGGPASCASQEPLTSQGYYFDGIEGYIYPAGTPLAQRPGTVALYRKYSATDKAFALVLETEEALPAFAAAAGVSGYTSGRTLLGFVYPTVTYASGAPSYLDADGDGLPDGFELALGTDPNKVDTDGDGASDLAEYPVSGVQPQGADPLGP